jgi:hypothetical protein
MHDIVNIYVFADEFKPRSIAPLIKSLLPCVIEIYSFHVIKRGLSQCIINLTKNYSVVLFRIVIFQAQ